jgi:hypothetical protein
VAIVRAEVDHERVRHPARPLPLPQPTQPTQRVSQPTQRLTVGVTDARAGNRRFQRLSASRGHTKSPYDRDLLWRTLRALERAGPDSIVDVDLGFGRIVTSEIEAPNMLVHLV